MVLRLCLTSSASLAPCCPVGFSGRLSKSQRLFVSTGSQPFSLSSLTSLARTKVDPELETVP
uniref:Uncharacterized protein n=1 Tax=Candidatus Kentrum sp. TC TaxID=2126339 RepID=A0A450Z2E9_9GAMM|nr:MAG: hypothetical protein BECKTC1821E_GA0114239_10977 [Candidatus Kentron sp. TC]VFK51626.1 MAG: hypothetical protein BECKTC1821D_GA0114238_11361 [Candidatus Kentron sp. TC]VFK63577.1 MAG: hypothetical protein BECKTC1821F_GA0114240_11004 [Candidatus Kentron sp. TC]